MTNLLIEASAGTGKTQSLGHRLIALLREGVQPQEIVALTFSRAAAGEIFERFVTLLAESAGTDARDARLLREVLATQHLSQIGTLDGFLLRLVRAFPLELGLVGELTVMDDYAASCERVAVSFSILRRTEARLKKAFVEAFSLATDRQDVRSFVDAYRTFVATWHERVAAFPDASAWGDPAAIWGEDKAFAHVTERELGAAADAVLAAGLTEKKWLEFADWVRSFRGSLSKVGGYAGRLLETEDAFTHGAFSFVFGRRQVTVGPQAAQAVRQALLCVCGYAVRQKLELARGIYRLVSAFETAYDRRVRRTGKLVFADVPRLVTSLSEADRLALEFRTDSRIRAWALDEFQDTSREQWSALSNLIDEAKQSDGEKSLFVVGDRKQAIYGWRNGDVGIFARERDSGFYERRELAKTFRSGPAVVEAVNRVFARGRILSEFPAWTCPEHETAKPELAGFVRTMEAAGRRQADFVEPVYEALRANRGRTTAVLVRTNAFGERLAAELRARGLEGVIWEGDSAILDTPALSGFLDLVQLADHPGDAMAYRHFGMTPLAGAKYPGGLPPADVISREMALAFTARGLVRTLRELRALLPEDPQTAWSAFTEERFTELLRAAAEFERTLAPGTRLADFPRFLRSKRRRNVADEGQIRILTIHRSKGLGFDYVVLPLYEPDALDAEPSGPLVGEGWILPALGRQVAQAVGGLADAWRLRRDRAEQEALCAYYVAMTRAKRAMTVVLMPATTTPGAGVRFSDLVRSADLSGLANPEVTLPPAAAAATAASAATAAAAPPVRAPRSRVARRLPSERFEDGLSAGSLFADSARRDALERGTAFHAEMERVDFSPALPKPEGFVALWREKPFEVCADGEWVSGRFDRVTFFRRDGELCAEIVDFKLSVADPGRYAAQLAAYRRAVRALTGIPEDRIAARLVSAVETGRDAP